MDVSQPTIPGPSLSTGAAVCQPLPDSEPTSIHTPVGDEYKDGRSKQAGQSVSPHQPQAYTQMGPFVAVAVGVLLVVLVGSVGTARAAWKHITILLSTTASSSADTARASEPVPVELGRSELAQLDRMDPQGQAEALLERAVGESGGALDEISSRLAGWQGKIKWDAQIANLTTAALSSRDLRVRGIGVEVELAAYGLAQNTASLNYVLHMARSSDHAKKVWALWAIGLLANRGVGTPLAVQALTDRLQDSDQDSRRWAVASLAMAGSSQALALLLRTMHDDPSPSVRQTAASSLAESGMLSREQRLAAVPELLSFTEDRALDEQTRTWAFQALGCITGQHLPNDSRTWRLWFTSAKVN